MIALSRLNLKLHRFEVLAAGCSALALALAALVVAVRLRSVGVPLSCFSASLNSDAGPSAACSTAINRFVEIDRQEAAVLFAILLIFPVFAGLLVGVPAVGREIERGTAWLPWTLDGSRRLWLARRIAILAAIMVAAMIPLAWATDVLEAARTPQVDPSMSFGDDGVRGIVVIARMLGGFSLGVLIGLLIGRQLPGLIVGVLVSAGLIVGLTVAMDTWSAKVAVTRPAGSAQIGDKAIATRLRDGTGNLLTFAQVDAMQPPQLNLPAGTINEQWVQAHFSEVVLVVPGDRYAQSVLLQLSLLAIGCAAATAGSLVMIEHRRSI